MRVRKFTSSANDHHGCPMFSERSLSTTTALVITSRLGCAMLLILAATTAELRGQTPREAEQAQRAECEADVLSPGNAANAKPPTDIVDGTKAALACEWTDPKAVRKVLNAFGFLIASPRDPESLQRALEQLEAGDPYPDPADREFYRAAVGNPSGNGEPSAQELLDLLDVVAMANTLNKKPHDEDSLFTATEKFFDKTFSNKLQRIALAEIDDLFQRRDYSALYQLRPRGAWQPHHRPRFAVTLNADESAGGPLYTGPGATDPAFNTSRVANHDTTTRVRVDSMKLFEVSSFSAIVERSRSRFPPLPPFVEIPYIGTFAGIPLGSAKEFHSSTAIISAYVVPTASDIAYGPHFVSDLAVDGPKPGSCSFFRGAAGPDVKNVCVFRKMFSLHDVGEQQPIREFNKNITRCFATDTSSDGCRRVSFDYALQSW